MLQNIGFQSIMAILSSKSKSPTSQPRAHSEPSGVTVCVRLLFEGNSSRERAEENQQMAHTWGRGRSGLRVMDHSAHTLTCARAHTHSRSSSTLKQKAQGADFGRFRSVSLRFFPSLAPVYLLSRRSHRMSPIIPIIISPSSRALCKPRWRFSCL